MESSPWKALHWQLDPDTVFLNHGSFGACPRPVMQEQRRLQEEMERNPVRFLARRHDELLDAARQEIAPFLGTAPADMVFVTNATTAVNSVVRSLEFRPGDEILTTNLDYNACRNVLREVCAKTGAVLVVAEIPFPLESSSQVVDRILTAVTGRTRLAMIDHVTSNTALVLPIAEIVAKLAERGVDTLVDGAHAPGMVALELEQLGAAYYTGNLHKWVCAPKGAAFLRVRPDKQEILRPAVISHGMNLSRAGHTRFQDRFDWAGSHDLTSWLAAPTAVHWLGELLPGGWQELRERNHAMVVAARQLLCERLEIAPPCPEDMLGSMATLPMPGKLATDLLDQSPDPIYGSLCDDHGIELQVVKFDHRRWFRISSHLHNSTDEYRYLADVLAKMR